MKDLVIYIQENNQLSLSEYIIEEGFFDWLKKMWNWIFGDAEKKTKENGYYPSGDNINDSAKNNKKVKGSFTFPQLDNKKFMKIINETNSTDNKSGTFYVAYKYHNENPKLLICEIVNNDKNESSQIGFVFYTNKENTIKIDKIIFGQDTVKMCKNIKKSIISKQISDEFINWSKNKFKKNKVVDKYNLDEIIDNTIIKDYNPEEKTDNKKPKDQNTKDKQSLDNKLENVINKDVKSEVKNQSKSDKTDENNKIELDNIDIIISEIKNPKELFEKIENKKYQVALLKKLNSYKDNNIRVFKVDNKLKESTIFIGIIFGEMISKEKINIIGNMYFNPVVMKKYNISNKFIDKLSEIQVEYFNNHKDFYLADSNDILEYNKNKKTVS